MTRAALLLAVVAATVASAAAAADPPARAVLHLTNGGYVPGELCASDDATGLRWRSPAFVRPLEFPLGAVKAVHYAVPPEVTRPAGDYCVELVNDDILYGDLLAVTDAGVELTSPRTGRVILRRDHVRRLYRWTGADAVYLGPNGLAGRDGPDAAARWTDEGGRLSTARQGATLLGRVGIPERAVIEVELSWAKKPDFVLALGVDER